MTEWKKRLLAVGAILAVRLALVAALAALMQERLAVSGTDVRTAYLPAAKALVAGDGLTLPPDGHLLTRYPPGYSLYLAATLWVAEVWGTGYAVVRFAVDNVLVAGLTLILLCRLWEGLGLSLHLALAATALFALHPAYLWGTLIPDTLTPFTGVLVGTVLCWVQGVAADRHRGLPLFFLAGCGLGLLCLLRPTPMFLPLLAAAALLARRRHLASAAVLIAGSLLITGPWVLYASVRSGEFVPLSTGGPPSVWDGLRALRGNRVADAFREHPEVQTQLPAIGGLLWQELREHPGAGAALLARKTVRSLYGTDAGGRAEWGLLAVNGLLLALGGCGWLHLRRRAPPALRYDLPLLFLYFWGTTVAVLSICRYMTPVLWLPAGLAVVAIDAVVHAGKNTETRPAS